MNDFLRQIGLVSDLTLELPVERIDFEKSLKLHLDKPQPDFFDILSGSEKMYKGTVKHDSFEMKRRRRFFDGNMNFVRVKGRYTQKSDKLIVDMELIAFHPMMFLFVGIALAAYISAIIFSFAGNEAADGLQWMPFFILIHAALMFGIPYIVVRRRLQSTRYEIERDLYFMIKDRRTSVVD